MKLNLCSITEHRKVFLPLMVFLPLIARSLGKLVRLIGMLYEQMFNLLLIFFEQLSKKKDAVL